MTISSTNPQIKTKISLLLPGELIAKLVRHCSFLKPVTSLSVAPAGVGLSGARGSPPVGFPPVGFPLLPVAFVLRSRVFARWRHVAGPLASLVSFSTIGSYFLHRLPWMLDLLKLQSLSVLLGKLSFLFLILLPFISSQITWWINVCFFPPNYIKIRKRKIKYIQKD